MAAGRRQFIASAGAGLLVTAAAPARAAPGEIVAGDMWLGDAHARVTVIEYASLACPHCAAFHAEIWPRLKATYVDTGKIRFVFREFPTGQPVIATAEHLLARCMATTPAQYFGAVDTFFEQQPAIFAAAQAGTVREKLAEIAQGGGLSEDGFNRCLSDEAQLARLNAVAQDGDRQFNIVGTPTVVIDGEVAPNTIEAPYTYERLAALIDARLHRRRRFLRRSP